MIMKQISILSSYLSQSLRYNVTKLEVRNFKVKWCNENKIITEILKSKLNETIEAPILDIGAGLGDIAYTAFPQKEAVLLDINKITDKDFPISVKHSRVYSNFFNYIPKQDFNTLLISHSLQFIDDDLEKLNFKIEEFKAKYIVVVINNNDGIMGEILSWINQKTDSSNPEVEIIGFPANYKLEKNVFFSANLICPTFQELAKQISYLMVIDYMSVKSDLVSFLKTKLEIPSFAINQSIKVYLRYEEKQPPYTH